MQGRTITMLGTGLIGDFYTMTLHGQRSPAAIRCGSCTPAARSAVGRSASIKDPASGDFLDRGVDVS